MSRLLGKCLSCVSEFISERNKVEGDESAPALVFEDLVEDAITMAPSWQQTMVGNQLMMACVTVPVCMRHIDVKEQSAAQRILGGGLTLPGLS